jgi:hypothetical protein
MEIMLTSEQYQFTDAHQAIEFYFKQGWTDGLPIVPPTPDLIKKFIGHSGYTSDQIIGEEPVKGRTVTIEKAAINSVMAGCIPEYFPIIIAATKAILESEFCLHGVTASTMGAGVLSIIDGPIVDKLSINSEVSTFGPGHRANATIGRAIRLIIINATGSKSGELDKATLGHPGKYTWCIAENTKGSPWVSLGKEKGFGELKSSITVFAGLSSIQVSNHHSNTPEGILRSFRDALWATGPNQGEILIVICPEHAKIISDSGWSKNDVKEFLHKMTARPDHEWGAGSLPPLGNVPSGDTISSATLSPDSYNIIVAGGSAGAFSTVIPMWVAGIGSKSVTKEI